MVFMAKENKLSSKTKETSLESTYVMRIFYSPKIDHFLNYRKNSMYVLSQHIPPKHYRNIFFLKTSFNIFSVLNQAEILQDRFVPLSKYWKKELLFTESSILKISTKNVQFLGFLLKKVKINFTYTFPTFIYVSKNTSFAKDPLEPPQVAGFSISSKSNLEREREQTFFGNIYG